MTFDVKAFMETNFIPREAEVEIVEPELKNFFNSEDKQVWFVKGLTGPQLGRAEAIAVASEDLKKMIEGLLSRRSKDKAEAIQKLAGLSEDLPVDIAKRIEHLVMGSVVPEVDHQLAVKLCDTFPVEFYLVTTKIAEISGKGHVPGKAKPSGKTKKSSSR